MEGQDSISDAEWNGMISTQYGELYACVAETGLRYFETQGTISTTGAASYDEPDDHWSTVGIDFRISAQGNRRPLFEAMPSETNAFSGQTGEAFAYALIDDLVYLYPTPPSGQTYYHRYIPQPPDFSEEEDGFILDVVTPDGESFLIWGTAVAAKEKEGTDSSGARAERDAARGRLWQWAALRAFNHRRKIVDDEPVWRDPGEWWP